MSTMERLLSAGGRAHARRLLSVNGRAHARRLANKTQWWAFALAALLMINMAYEKWPDILYARFFGGHLVTYMVWLAVTVNIKYKLKSNWDGFYNTLMISLLIAISGEIFFNFWFQAYHWYLWYEPVMWLQLFGTLNFLLIIAAPLMLRSYRALIRRRFTITMLVESALMLVWIFGFGFLVSECTCDYGRLYENSFIPNTFEVLYYMIWFVGVTWALKPKEALRELPWRGRGKCSS